MYAEPRGFDRRPLLATLRRHWSLAVSSLRYEPVGFGTHHYLARDASGASWFVNLDDLGSKDWIAPYADQALDALDRAFRTAAALRRAGLEFVHAPVESIHGAVTVPLDGKYAVSVWAYIEGASGATGEYTSEHDRRRVLHALGRMHAAGDRVPADLPRRDTLRIPLRERLFEALDDLSSPWTGGPFAEPARRLLSEHAGDVRTRFDHYDELARAVESSGERWVVTHGEPHAGNVMTTAGGELFLIDWDTAALAPRERDLWMVASKDGDWEAYAASGGTSRIDASAMRLYALWWSLAEITGYTDAFRRPHEDDANTRVAWSGLRSYVAGATPEWGL